MEIRRFAASRFVFRGIAGARCLGRALRDLDASDRIYALSRNEEAGETPTNNGHGQGGTEGLDFSHGGITDGAIGLGLTHSHGSHGCPVRS